MRCFVVACILCCVVSKASIAEPVFLQHRIADPLNLLASIPAYSSPSNDNVQIQVGGSYANVFSGGIGNPVTGEDRLVMDGEIGQVELRAQWSVNSCYTLGLDSRLISHSGGSFDSEIDTFHQIFQLPDAMRELSPFDSLTYLFSTDGAVNPDTNEFSETQVSLVTSQQSLGDLWLSVQRPLSCSPNSSVLNALGHVRVGVKLPLDGLTDNVEAWASGGQSAIFADWHQQPYQLSEKARVISTLGVSYSGEFDERFSALPARRLLGYGAVVFDYAWNARWQSIVQLDIRSPTFESELTEIGDWGAQIHLGARVTLFGPHQLEFSFSEDAAVDTAPDIGVRVAYTYSPRSK